MATLNHESEAIRPGELYSMADVMRRLGWGRAAMRTARSNGLKVIREGGRCFILADDILGYFKNRAQAI